MIIHQLSVHQIDSGEQFISAVHTVQECGKIRGGGTCPQPLYIELSPTYEAAPMLLKALQGIMSRVSPIDPLNPQHDEEYMACVQAIEAATKIKEPKDLREGL